MLSLFLALAVQDPPRTVEEHLRQLEAKIAALERRSKALADENAQLEKKMADRKAAKESYARQVAQAWVKRYAASAGFTEAQSAGLEDLWKGWLAKDQEGAPGYWDSDWRKQEKERWSPREESIRTRLEPDQVAKLAAKVGEEQEQLARASLGSFVKEAKLTAGPFEKAVLARLKFPEGAILLQARPDERVDWFKVLAAVEESLPDLEKVLSEVEIASLRATVAKWKAPRRP